MKAPTLSPTLIALIVQAVQAMLAGDSALAVRRAREAAQTAAMDEALGRRPRGKK